MSFSQIDATSSTLLSIIVSFNLFICVLMIQYDAYSLRFDKPSAPILSSLLLPLQTLRYSSIRYTSNSLLLSSFTSISTPFNSHIIVSSEDIEYFLLYHPLSWITYIWFVRGLCYLFFFQTYFQHHYYIATFLSLVVLPQYTTIQYLF